MRRPRKKHETKGAALERRQSADDAARGCSALHEARQADLDRYKILIAIPIQLINGLD